MPVLVVRHKGVCEMLLFVCCFFLIHNQSGVGPNVEASWGTTLPRTDVGWRDSRKLYARLIPRHLASHYDWSLNLKLTITLTTVALTVPLKSLPWQCCPVFSDNEHGTSPWRFSTENKTEEWISSETKRLHNTSVSVNLFLSCCTLSTGIPSERLRELMSGKVGKTALGFSENVVWRAKRTHRTNSNKVRNAIVWMRQIKLQIGLF